MARLVSEEKAPREPPSSACILLMISRQTSRHRAARLGIQFQQGGRAGFIQALDAAQLSG